MRPAPARIPVVRLPARRTVVAVVLAVVAALIVHRTTATAVATRVAWGETAAVWVADRPLEPGTVLDATTARAASHPVALVPAGAVTADPTGRVLVAWSAAGEILVEDRLADGARVGAAALVPEGWRGVAIPQHEAPLPVVVGQRVDVVAAFDPGSGVPAAGTVVVPDGIVVHVADDGTVTVAVPDDDTVRVTAALLSGVVRLALVR